MEIFVDYIFLCCQPSEMEFIQIDITNACNMRCSNCTRFCGNHAGTFFMDFDIFKRAIDSMEGYEGVVGDRYIARYEDRFKEQNSLLFKMD